jgi:HK97 family phage major capsid protein
MNIQLSNRALLEISSLSTQAESLARGNTNDRMQASILVQRIASIRQSGISSDEMRSKYTGALIEDLHGGNPEAIERRYEKAFVSYLKGDDGNQLRGFLAGAQSITYTQPTSGGYLVPALMQASIFEALSQICPLFSADVVSLDQGATFASQPKQLSGWDLTAITSTQIGEGQTQAPSATPVVRGKTINGYTQRVTLAASLEAEQEIIGINDKFARAFAVGWGRGAGNLITVGLGSGSAQPQGIYTGAASSGLTLGGQLPSGGRITAAEINAVYFSINRIYRSSPKCAWLVPDSVHKALRNSTDDSGRPLLSMHDDDEVLLGKKIYITPDLPDVGGSPLANGALIFGDLSHFIVRTSAPWIQRTVESAGTIGSILNGECLFHGRIRVDSYLFDPSAGANPPVVSAVVAHS